MSSHQSGFGGGGGKDKSCQIERVCAPLFTDTFCVCETVNVLGLVAAEMRLL